MSKVEVEIDERLPADLKILCCQLLKGDLSALATT